MDWDLVQMFVEVVDAGSLSEASRRRGVTRSAYSQRLKLLEQQLNTQLLRRTTRKVELTDAGFRLYAHGSRMAQEFDAACSEIAEFETTLSGQVRISVPLGLGEKYLNEVLIRFARQHPNIALRVLFNNRVTDLAESEIDIAVKITSEPPLDVVAREISAIQWHFYCTPAYRVALARCNEPEDLADAAFLSPKEGRSVTFELVSASRSVSLRVLPRLASERLPFLLECALAGMGVALLPSYMTREVVAIGALERVLPEYESNFLGAKLFILTTPNRYPSPAAQALIELLKAELPKYIHGAD